MYKRVKEVMPSSVGEPRRPRRRPNQAQESVGWWRTIVCSRKHGRSLSANRPTKYRPTALVGRKAQSNYPLADWPALFVRFAFWPLIFALLALLELL